MQVEAIDNVEREGKIVGYYTRCFNAFLIAKQILIEIDIYCLFYNIRYKYRNTVIIQSVFNVP